MGRTHHCPRWQQLCPCIICGCYFYCWGASRLQVACCHILWILIFSNGTVAGGLQLEAREFWAWFELLAVDWFDFVCFRAEHICLAFRWVSLLNVSSCLAFCNVSQCLSKALEDALLTFKQSLKDRKEDVDREGLDAWLRHPLLPCVMHSTRSRTEYRPREYMHRGIG